MKPIGSSKNYFGLIVILVVVLVGDASAKTKCKFGIPTHLGSYVNSSAAEGPFCISSDGLELYFTSNRSAGIGDRDIWLSTRPTVSATWDWPVNLGTPINTLDWDGGPCISADGLELYFCSNRYGGEGNLDLWVSTRATTSDPWGTPVNLGSTVNTWADEAFPRMSADGLELYFCEYTVPRPDGHGDGDIWVTKRASVTDEWGTPENLGPEVNTPYKEGAMELSADGLSLYFGSDRPAGYGLTDIWVTTRLTTSYPWGIPVNMGPSVNSSADDTCPNLSPVGLVFYFGSTRYGTLGYNDYWQVSVWLVSTADLDENGVVDLRDFAELAEDWLEVIYVPGPTVDDFPLPDFCGTGGGC